MEYRQILKGSAPIILEGRRLTQHIKLPKGYDFAESFLYQVGFGVKTVKDAEALAIELHDYSKVRNCVHK